MKEGDISREILYGVWGRAVNVLGETECLQM